MLRNILPFSYLSNRPRNENYTRNAMCPRAKHVREAFAMGIRCFATSVLLASLKGFPLLSGVLYSAERISPERISPFGMHPRSGPVPSGFIHEVELLFLLRNAYCVIGTTLLIYRQRHSQQRCCRPKDIRLRHSWLCHIRCFATFAFGISIFQQSHFLQHL